MFFRPGTTRIPFRTGDEARKGGSDGRRIELDPANDYHARAAMEAYADSCALDMPWLAEWLRDSTAGGDAGLTNCASTVRRVFDLAQEWASREPDYAHAAWEHVRMGLEAALSAHLRPKEHVDDKVAALSGAGAKA
ncbi:hypothetical protein GCT13_33285 [Paraburkholderia sp. CNPSo 3157]|uniref:Peptidase n=1 Tax=Paraburkholderia franconis TaxID=2654983 RepID=A0A7X1TJJ4_9BURK|nr:hypothetical protein [Paraburkholderia franconis]MPW21615.1 hypothetical protein [Paraburkholderia franconis]